MLNDIFMLESWKWGVCVWVMDHVDYISLIPKVLWIFRVEEIASSSPFIICIILIKVWFSLHYSL